MADGQTVPANEPFIVGGEEMMFPGDTAGSPWNVYNCRCAMRSVDREDLEEELRKIRVRDPVTGKNVVVTDMTYSEWLEWKKQREAGAVKPAEKSQKSTSTKKTTKASKEKDEKSLKNEQNRSILKEKIANGEVSTKISVQQHAKHVTGTPQYEKYKTDRLAKGKTPQSTTNLTLEEEQAIIDKYKCTGRVKIVNGKVTEYCSTDIVVGKYHNGETYVDTRRVEIHYSKRSAHVVPVKEGYNG